MKRILLSAILIAAILIGVTGCMFDNESEQSVSELALEYLEQKYGEKFEYSAPAGSSYTGTITFLATCESFGNNRVLVQIENYKDAENRIVKDNYIAVKYKDNLREFFEQSADEEFGSSKIFCSSTARTLSPELSSNASYEDYLKCKDGLISTVIGLPESGYKDAEQFKRLSDKISNTLLCDEISILFIVVDDDTFESADEDELRNISLTKSGVAHARIDRYNGETKMDISGED